MQDNRLSEALRDAAKALGEAAGILREGAECEPRCDCREEECCHEGHEPPEPCHDACGAAPAPPYPPFPPYAPMPPYPPFPPYPPYVIVTGGGGCGCGCHGQTTAAAAPVPPSSAPSQSPAAASAPASGSPAAATASAAAGSPFQFPDLSNISSFDALLDMGETAAEMVRNLAPGDPKPQESSNE